MANSMPPWVTPMQFVVTIDNKPVTPEAATENAWGGQGQYTGTSTNYQTVVSATVPAGKLGELKEIIFVAADYTHVLLEIDVGGITWTTNWAPLAAEPVIFEDLKLAAGSVVTVKAKSNDGTAITVDAIIVAKEIG